MERVWPAGPCGGQRDMRSLFYSQVGRWQQVKPAGCRSHMRCSEACGTGAGPDRVLLPLVCTLLCTPAKRLGQGQVKSRSACRGRRLCQSSSITLGTALGCVSRAAGAGAMGQLESQSSRAGGGLQLGSRCSGVSRAVRKEQHGAGSHLTREGRQHHDVRCHAGSRACVAEAATYVP